MKRKERFFTLCVITTVTLTICGISQALPTTLVQVLDLPTQDPLIVPWDVHELGTGFPPDESIVTGFEPHIDFTPCLDPQITDDPGLPNPLVWMVNVTNSPWYEVWYVGDTDPTGTIETYLSNFDGVVNGGLAFKIDNVGLNIPLIYESLTVDNIFEPGETWAFVIQDYFNIYGLTPDLMGSPGVGIFSAGDQISSGSIIAIPAPGAILLGSIGVGLVGWLRKRRTL